MDEREREKGGRERHLLLEIPQPLRPSESLNGDSGKVKSA